MERATLALVAQRAGVSKATASKALNGRDGVSAETRERVLNVMKELRYVPITGRAIGGVPAMVTVLFDAHDSLYAAHVMSGVVAAGLEFDVDVVVTNPTSRHHFEPLTVDWFRRIADKGHIGVIVVTTEMTPETARVASDAGLAVVAVDPVNPRDVDDELISVSATNWRGGLQATQHLIDLGHRRIGFAGGRPESQPGRERFQGHLAALQGADIEFEPDLIRRAGFRYSAGRSMGEELLGLSPPPTAIAAGCDASALGFMAAARQRNLRLPDDLSIVGFDDTYAAESASPLLTTIRQPLREMGRVAIRTVLSMARGDVPETNHFELATTLVVRDSTAPPNGTDPTSTAHSVTPDLPRAVTPHPLRPSRAKRSRPSPTE